MLNPLFMSSLLRTPSEKWIANRMECDFFFFGGKVLGTIEGKKIICAAAAAAVAK